MTTIETVVQVQGMELKVQFDYYVGTNNTDDKSEMHIGFVNDIEAEGNLSASFESNIKAACWESLSVSANDGCDFEN